MENSGTRQIFYISNGRSLEMTKSIRISLIIGFILYCIFLVGCGGKQSKPSESPGVPKVITPSITITSSSASIEPSATSIPPTTATPEPTAKPTTNPPTETPETVTGVAIVKLLLRENQEPIVGGSIFLCLIIDMEAEEPECILNNQLLVKTDVDGSANFDEIEPGSYLVVYGLPIEIKDSSQGLHGKAVTYKTSIAPSGPFGKVTDPFGGSLDILVSPEVAEVVISGTGMFVTNGAITSREYGLSIEYRDSNPTIIEVVAGEIIEITVEVSQRAY